MFSVLLFRFRIIFQVSVIDCLTPVMLGNVHSKEVESMCSVPAPHYLRYSPSFYKLQISIIVFFYGSPGQVF